jgi:hypothetical protein
VKKRNKEMGFGKRKTKVFWLKTKNEKYMMGFLKATVRYEKEKKGVKKNEKRL